MPELFQSIDYLAFLSIELRFCVDIAKTVSKTGEGHRYFRLFGILVLFSPLVQQTVTSYDRHCINSAGLLITQTLQALLSCTAISQSLKRVIKTMNIKMTPASLGRHTARLLLISFALTGQNVSADIYSYIDSEGNRWITNGSVSGQKNVKLLRKTPKKKAPVVAAATGSSGSRVYKGKIGCGSHQKISNKTQAYLPTIRKYAETYNVEENLIRALIRQESCFNPQAVSHAGAMGLMQLMPGTADMMGVSNAMSPKQNIRGGVKYLSRMLRRFGGNKELALAGYNAGPGAVDKHNGIPPYRETQNYVVKVMSEYQRLTGQGGITRSGNSFSRSGRQ